MKTSFSDGRLVQNSILAARVALATSGAALILLAALHVLSPEFDASVRVVSEYALGRYGWVLSLMFLTWGLSSWALAVALRPALTTIGGRVGLVFLILAGLGEALASLFDLKHAEMHGLAGALGVLGLPIAATLISVGLGHTQVWRSHRKTLLWLATLTWVRLLSLVAAMLTLTRKTGPRLAIGWPNRILVVVYSVWVMSVAWQAIKLGKTARSLENGRDSSVHT